MKNKRVWLVAQRGRPDAMGGASNRQRLEVNHTGRTNAITTVAKDNLILERKLNGIRTNKNNK